MKGNSVVKFNRSTPRRETAKTRKGAKIWGAKIPLRFSGYFASLRCQYNLTKFECKVLKACLKIPLGRTRTYQWVAEQIGHTKAFRAVGSALKKNPYPLIIPCHRVIKSDGKIGGFSGGKKLKIFLLELEKRLKPKLAK